MIYANAAPQPGPMQATYSNDGGGVRFQLPITRKGGHRLEVIELGLRVAFDLAQENESSPDARPFILKARNEGTW